MRSNFLLQAASNMTLPKENSSGSFKSNELHGSIGNCNQTNYSQILPEKDPNNNLSLIQQEKSEILIDPTLDYISRYLLEEEINEKINGYQEEALRAMEKPFYDILGEKYPPPQDNQLISKQSKVNPGFTTSDLIDHVVPTCSESLEQHPCIENLLAIIEFQRGVEEGLKFLPNQNSSSINLHVSNLSLNPTKKCDRNSLQIKSEEEKESDLRNKSKGKKNTNDANLDLLEGRNCKIPMVNNEETIRDEMFDKALLYQRGNCQKQEIASPRKIKELKANSYSENQNQHNHINLETHLISCAEAISINDNKIASELIKQIRKEASPIGDGIQRLACILADGLEARLAGTRSAAYRQYVTRKVCTIDYLKANYMCSRVSPAPRLGYHFANESILSAISNATKIHVVDFGITFGFQWPSLIQSLTKRKGGPPKLRITGVDLPQPGFHPAERINETGRRLEDYARSFGVPFEYQGIASHWESVCIDDLSINDDEVLIVNTMYNLGRVRDEPLLHSNDPRTKLLDLIKEIKPKIFIQGIFNVSFSPFFIARFRNVLLHFSRFFDLLDTLIPRDYKLRQLMEREMLGPSIINLIACEGPDLVVRLESYKQWHMRNLQIGFEQLPVDPGVVKECREMVRNDYNKAFFIEEDCNWFLWGWKGNIIYGVSLWKPKVE
ncbi:scarecrow-like protein 14 [Carex rostrata]